MGSTLVETININAKDFTEHFLTCSTCINQYSSDSHEHQPKLLPCSHTVCRQCLEHIVSSQPRSDAIKCPICREHILLPRGGVTSFPPSFLVNQLLDLMVSQRRDVIPKCDSHTNEELLFCETCDKIFCQLCDQHQISAEHTVVPFSLAIKRMNEILSFKATKTTSCLDHALELVNNEIHRLDSSMEKAAEAIDRSFNEIKSYVENRRHNLLQSLKTTRDYKLKILNDQLNVILNEKSKIEHECAAFQQASDIHVLTQRIQELNDRIERMSLLGEPRENSFMKFEFRHNQALQDLARSLNSVGRIRVSSTYPPLCRAKIESPVANLQCAIHIETVDYNGNVRVDGGDPLTVNIWDSYGKLCEYDLYDKQSGSYTIIFRPLISGNHKIDIRIFDRPISGSPFIVDVTKHNNPLWSFGKRGRGENELSMPVSVIVDDRNEREHVSHHPPITVCTCISPNFLFSQKLQATVKFWEILPDSLNTLILSKYNEIITWNKCTMCIHNVLSPERWIDHYGDVIVESSSGSKARISFIQSDYRTRLNNVAGDIVDATGKVVHKIFGHWHENVFCGNDQTAKCIWRQSAVPENSKQYYGFTRFAIELNELDDDLRKQLPPTDTRFRPDQRLLEAGQVEKAEKEKARIEQAQRKRSASGLSPKWFKRDGDSFVLIRDEDLQHNYWKKREENWTGVEFIELW
ncbi:unnamed protein product [Rotaria sp. Silwood1]|nr:unnamed protein product [Rotaria sp. Silwood1]